MFRIWTISCSFFYDMWYQISVDFFKDYLLCLKKISRFILASMRVPVAFCAIQSTHKYTGPVTTQQRENGRNEWVRINLLVVNQYVLTDRFIPSFLYQNVVSMIFVKNVLPDTDPSITITLDEEPVTGGNTHPRTPTEIICSVNMTSSQPRFKVYYLGDQTHTKEHLYTKSEFKKHALYNHGKYFVGIRLPPSKGIVVCQVEDSLGTYTKHQEIVGRGEINLIYIKQLISFEWVSRSGSVSWKQLATQKCTLFKTANET